VGFSDRKNSIALIADFYSNNKPVAFVCHSPGALKKKLTVNFSKRKNRFSNAEEAAVGLTDVVPFY
jgi:putative intracellular protease/amidase